VDKLAVSSSRCTVQGSSAIWRGWITDGPTLRRDASSIEKSLSAVITQVAVRGGAVEYLGVGGTKQPEVHNLPDLVAGCCEGLSESRRKVRVEQKRHAGHRHLALVHDGGGEPRAASASARAGVVS
jgi:hypothetical protein